ncbi:MAG: DUF1638 domain-containing protein [Anaerolineae bacterium]|nr:DUF1638 domain-containing protein [Anaerolineae bacterium]
MPKYLKALTCEVLARNAYRAAADSPHIVDVELLRKGLHNTPADLHAALQARIDAAAGEGFDAVLLAYGLCGQSLEGLRARDVPLVAPRAHDCITLYLGSRGRYAHEFTTNPGTYWFTLDYIERSRGSNGLVTLGSSDASLGLQATYEEYVEKYGQDNADYLMEVMGAWHAHYNRAAFIDMGVGDQTPAEDEARRFAAERNWNFERMAGDDTLIRRLLFGEWDHDFLVVPPGEMIVQRMNESILASVPVIAEDEGK